MSAVLLLRQIAALFTGAAKLHFLWSLRRRPTELELKSDFSYFMGAVTVPSMSLSASTHLCLLHWYSGLRNPPRVLPINDTIPDHGAYLLLQISRRDDYLVCARPSHPLGPGGLMTQNVLNTGGKFVREGEHAATAVYICISLFDHGRTIYRLGQLQKNIKAA
ncbi:hypothetical protein BDN70DRAFT_579674 [Pholiota conissans]|uniref:Uncharacterized protein n=1 Tax=Pholiota conissans TaxID=109636 RepID=A0A9P5Z695_9AGAR|nr:hypothetical protein BDN70DRAFT_579674 [Pholiota conissans]